MKQMLPILISILIALVLIVLGMLGVRAWLKFRADQLAAVQNPTPQQTSDAARALEWVDLVERVMGLPWFNRDGNA